MPDDNKFAKLREVGYQVSPCCHLCSHAEFGADGWGTCKLHQYAHKKHTGPSRGVSIHSTGKCREGFSPDLKKVYGHLGAHSEFFDAEG